jgi:hypothetical protein
VRSGGSGQGQRQKEKPSSLLRPCVASWGFFGAACSALRLPVNSHGSYLLLDECHITRGGLFRLQTSLSSVFYFPENFQIVFFSSNVSEPPSMRLFVQQLQRHAPGLPPVFAEYVLVIDRPPRARSGFSCRQKKTRSSHKSVCCPTSAIRQPAASGISQTRGQGARRPLAAPKVSHVAGYLPLERALRLREGSWEGDRTQSTFLRQSSKQGCDSESPPAFHSSFSRRTRSP